MKTPQNHHPEVLVGREKGGVLELSWTPPQSYTPNPRPPQDTTNQPNTRGGGPGDGERSWEGPGEEEKEEENNGGDSKLGTPARVALQAAGQGPLGRGRPMDMRGCRVGVIPISVPV